VAILLYRATVVQSFSKFWVNIQSPAITAASAGDADGESGSNIPKPTTVRNFGFIII